MKEFIKCRRRTKILQAERKPYVQPQKPIGVFRSLEKDSQMHSRTQS